MSKKMSQHLKRSWVRFGLFASAAVALQLNPKHLHKYKQGADFFYTYNGNSFLRYNGSTYRYFILNNTGQKGN